MNLTHVEKGQLPHAVYWLYNRQMELLYVGCSYQLFGRLAVHGSRQDWISEVAAAKVKWFDNELLGKRAEAQAILSETPKYNVRAIDPDAVGTAEMKAHDRRPRGNGSDCPKCARPKQRRTAAYCNECYRAYQQIMKLRRAAKVAGPG